MRLHLLIASAASALIGGAAARADEPIKTAPSGAPPAASAPAAPLAPNSPDAIGAWARGVMAGEPAASPAPSSAARRCPAGDGKPHGEVWGGVGTGGYREAGGVVSQPLGDCAHVTVGVSRVQGRVRP